MIHFNYTREGLANFISQAVLRTRRGFEDDNPDMMVPEVAKMLVQPGPFCVERNEIENLVDILQTALCYHEDGIPEMRKSA